MRDISSYDVKKFSQNDLENIKENLDPAELKEKQKELKQ